MDRVAAKRARLAIVRAAPADATPAAAAEGSSSFEWDECWYPVAPLRELDRAAPSRWALLGRELVVWHAGDGADGAADGWRCADDACPHRNAPLSLGTRDAKTGELVCRYHGWRFDGDGACSELPMGGGRGACGLALRPTAVARGVLFAWGAAGPQAARRAEAAPPPDAGFPEWATSEDGVAWTMSETPASWYAQVSNALDPCHAEALHHGLLKYAPDNARAMDEFELVVSPDDTGFSMHHGPYSQRLGGAPAAATQTFHAPCSVSTEYTKLDEGTDEPVPTLSAHLMFCPAGPRTTRVMGMFLIGEGRKGVPAPPESGLLAGPGRLLHALFHLSNTKLLSQDLLMMQGEDEAADWWRGAARLPSVSDAGVRTLRAWIDTHGGDGPPCASAHGAEPPSIYDRYVLSAVSGPPGLTAHSMPLALACPPAVSGVCTPALR